MMMEKTDDLILEECPNCRVCAIENGVCLCCGTKLKKEDQYESHA